MSQQFIMHAKTLFGLEKVLARELKALGAADIHMRRRLVSFVGDRRLLYAANLWCRTAIRVLIPIESFVADSEASLYEGVQRIDWSQFLDVDGTLAIDPVVYSSFSTHSLFVAQLAKDAIVDQFRSRYGSRPSVDRDDPILRINLHVNENRATVYLDSSGDSLHKRGYRVITSQAPINEVLAAGILRLTEWKGHMPLVDFMCGSGTIPIEAAMLARNIAPGLTRRQFSFARWKDFDAALYQELLAEARDRYREQDPAGLQASDLDGEMVRAAEQNASRAGVDGDIHFLVSNFEQVEPPAEAGVLITNPPYDERLKSARIAAVYRRIGEVLASRWAGWRAYVFTGNLEAAEHLGLPAARSIPLFNGPIECRLLEFDLRKRGKKRPERNSERFEQPATSSSVRAPRDAAPRETVPRPIAIQTSAPDSSRHEDSDASPAEPVVITRAGWNEQAAMFRNRLARMGKHWSRWARRQSITCYRIYDRDVPDVPLAIDRYEDELHIAEYDRPHDRTDLEHQAWLTLMIETAASALDVPMSGVHVKRRQRQRGLAQYDRQDNQRNSREVQESGHRFLVNLSDYLDTGLFLDHRQTRQMVEREASGRRFLNLFAYTGAFSVYAAAGGAISTTTVDLSHTYLNWAQDNLRLNGFNQPWHEFVRSDALSFARELGRRRGPPFDLVVIDPPTFSNSKSTETIWDVQRDHAELLNFVLAHLAPTGKIYFSTNFRRFKLAEEELQGATIREITKHTVPPDFRNKRIHRCWTLVPAEAPNP